MKDMFDYLEEGWENGNHGEVVSLIKVIKNKKRQKIKTLFLSTISQTGKTEWTRDIRGAIILNQGMNYQIIRDTIRKYRISCQIYRRVFVDNVDKTVYTKPQPVRKEKWWDRIKVWFSRKVQYFAGYISIERD